MSELQERFQRWANELVDLTARNELINFKVTKTSTILPEPKGLSKLLNGDTVAITDLCDLTDPDQMKPAKGAIKTAIEFKEQRGIEVLKLAAGFATWKTDKISNANAPLFLYSVELENEGGAFINTKLRLVDTEPEINPAPAPAPDEPIAIAPEKEGGEPLIPQLGSIDDYGSELAEYIVWFCSDGVMYSNDEIFEAVFSKLPFSRRGARIVGRIEDEINQLRASGGIR